MQTNLQALCARAVGCHQQGDLAQAEALCRQVLSADPANITAGYLLGVLRLQAGRHLEAVERLEGVIALGLDEAEPHAMHAMALQAVGRLEAAAASYARAAALKPDHIQAHFNGAGILAELGRLDEALDGYDRALALRPGHAGVLYNRGAVLQDLGRSDEALNSYDRALAADPGFAEAWNNRGLALQRLGRPQEALDSYDRALALRPGFAEAWVNRGGVLKDLLRNQDALASFDRALAISPDFAEAWNSRGFVEQRLERLDEARQSFERALALKPDHGEALFNLGSVLCAGNEIAEGFAAFTRYALMMDAAPPVGDPAPPAPAHKLRHDAEQRAYLAALGRDVGGLSLGDRLHLEGGDRIAGPAVNPRQTGEVEAQWRSNSPQVVVIDSLLTPAALEALRRFCWGSTIWRGVYDNGYLGAMPESGFACPLLAQITEELRDAYPAIFAGHGLNYLWAFKYDSQMDGIELHADRAAVNVNFWITPDEANLDPTSGGLVVWDVAAPLDWNYDRYNGDVAASRQFLDDAGARPITIPYKANRAVIFDSDLFHKTDRIDFKDGYLNRRINVTLLYGRRSSDNR